MSGPTPIVDAVLGDPLGIPSNVDVWLREIERRARTLRVRTEAACSREGAIPLLVDAHGALAAFLDDPAASPLYRIIRRPLPQLAGGTPAHRSFTHLSDFLFRRAEDALELQSAADALRKQVAETRQRYGARAPYFTGVHLRAARVDEADLLRARRVADVRAMEARLVRAGAALEGIAARLPREREARDGDWVMTEDSGASADELRAALALRLLERSTAEAEETSTGEVRGIAVRQLRELGAAAGWARTARHPSHLVAERFAAEARAREPLARHGEDAELWRGLLHVSQLALNDPRDEAGWQPQVREAGADEEPAAGATLWMIPVDETYVLLTPELRSPVRVASRGVRLGETIECRLFGAPGTAESVQLARLELAPFFGGVDPAEPGWYRTRRNARFEVVGRRGIHWFARLVRPGEAERLRTSAWEESAPEAGAVRLLVSSSRLPPGGVVEAGPSGKAPTSFLGFETREVHTPLSDCRLGWLRTAAHPSAAARDALEREAELFRGLALRSPGLAPLHLGRARLAGSAAAGFLHGRPFALRLQECPPMEQWMRQDGRIAFIRAVSRLLEAIHESGYALGVCHPDAFAFGLEWPYAGTAPRPRAALVYAPCAARLGHPHQPPAPDAAADPLLYPRLRFRGLPSPVAGGYTALPETDAAAFTLLALELLAEEPFPATVGWLGWSELPVAVMQNAQQCFARPKLAMELARSLADEARWGALLRWQREIAAPHKGPGAEEEGRFSP